MTTTMTMMLMISKTMRCDTWMLSPGCALCRCASMQTCVCTVHPHAFRWSGRVPALRIIQNASGFLIFFSRHCIGNGR
jgi:hypothetical protein